MKQIRRTCIIAPTNRVIFLGISLKGGNTYNKKKKKKKKVFFPPCIKCAANRRPKIDYKKTPQNYTSICWGAEAIFLPFLSTTTADTVV